jgi:hypothetical protein
VTQWPKPADPTVAVVLRVIFTILPVISIGFLAWGSMLYLALLARRTVDWVMMAVSIALLLIALGLIGSDDSGSGSGGGTGLLLLCMFGGAAYFLVADIVRYRTARRMLPVVAGYPQPNPYATGFGVGGPMAPPHQGYPAGPGPIPNMPNAPMSRGASTPPPVNRPATPPPVNRPATPRQTPAPGPATTPPPAPRIDQVRAELDELSDFLRKEHGDSRDGGETAGETGVQGEGLTGGEDGGRTEGTR